MIWMLVEALNNISRFLTNLGFKFVKIGGPHSTVDSILASHPAAPGSILSVPKIFSDLDVVEIYRQRALLRQWKVQIA